jgi:hypothetical protein
MRMISRAFANSRLDLVLTLANIDSSMSGHSLIRGLDDVLQAGYKCRFDYSYVSCKQWSLIQ